jgi:predicted esterase
MKRIVPKVFIILLGLFYQTKLFSQSKTPELSSVNNNDKILKQIRSNTKIDADSTLKILNNWSNYSVIKETGHDYLFFYNHPEIGEIPMRVYIPSSYKASAKTGCVMFLHGAVGISHFKDVDSLFKFDSDVLINNLKAQNYIVIRPVGDREKKFNWAVNMYSGRGGTAPNPTFKILTDILVSLKKVLNIDDNKVFAFGHSDGSDGAVGLGVFTPDQFAGIVAYNSMLTNIFSYDFYIRNIQNRPLYIVHSDLDDLRPIQQARIIIDSLKTVDNNILYKEYIGYQHEDKHLDKDVPFACIYMKGTSRNPFHTSVYWETLRGEIYNGCDWLKLTIVDTTAKAARWHTPLITKAYNKKNKTWLKDFDYYWGMKKSVATMATFNNNTFIIQTSGVKEVELLISPVMVNIEEPIIVMANGKQVFNGKIKADKDFLLDGFQKTLDRQALWVNSIKVRIE